MSATLTTSESRNESARPTLGDVIYANSAKARVPESEWAALLQAIAAGDQLALHHLYGRMHRLVFTLAVRIIGSPQTAEEITVDVFHDVWRRAAGYDATGGTVVGWIMNQARSRALDRLRFEQRKKRTPPHQSATCEGDSGTASEEAFSADHQRRLLKAALLSLTPYEREAIETAFFCEYSYVETATHLNQPVGTIKTRIRSGLTKLRQTLAAENS